MEQNHNLSKNAQNIQTILTEKGIKTQVVELASSTRTAQDAAQSIGCTVEQIIKSLIFKTKDRGLPVLVLASGPNRVNETLIEQALGEKIVKADADFTREVTGFAIGGIPPLGHKQKMKTFIDKDLMQYKELWAAAGTPHAVFSLTSNDLLSITDGLLIAVHS